MDIFLSVKLIYMDFARVTKNIAKIFKSAWIMPLDGDYHCQKKPPKFPFSQLTRYGP